MQTLSQEMDEEKRVTRDHVQIIKERAHDRHQIELEVQSKLFKIDVLKQNKAKNMDA